MLSSLPGREDDDGWSRAFGARGRLADTRLLVSEGACGRLAGTRLLSRERARGHLADATVSMTPSRGGTPFETLLLSPLAMSEGAQYTPPAPIPRWGVRGPDCAVPAGNQPLRRGPRLGNAAPRVRAISMKWRAMAMRSLRTGVKPTRGPFGPSRLRGTQKRRRPPGFPEAAFAFRLEKTRDWPPTSYPPDRGRR